MNPWLWALAYFAGAIFTGALWGFGWRCEFNEDADPAWIGVAGLAWPLTLPIVVIGTWSTVLLRLLRFLRRRP